MRFAAFERFFNGADVQFFSNIFSGTRRNGVDLKISNAVKKIHFWGRSWKKIVFWWHFWIPFGWCIGEKNVGGGTRRKNWKYTIFGWFLYVLDLHSTDFIPSHTYFVLPRTPTLIPTDNAYQLGGQICVETGAENGFSALENPGVSYFNLKKINFPKNTPLTPLFNPYNRFDWETHHKNRFSTLENPRVRYSKSEKFIFRRTHPTYFKPLGFHHRSICVLKWKEQILGILFTVGI